MKKDNEYIKEVIKQKILKMIDDIIDEVFERDVYDSDIIRQFEKDME